MTHVSQLGGGYTDSEPDPGATVSAVLNAACAGDADSRLVVIAGPPGVGKSLLAAGLVRECGATHIDKDWVAGGFILDSAAQDGDIENAYGRRHYWQHLRPLEYGGAMTAACANLVGRRMVLLTGGWGPELAVDGLWSGLAQRLSPCTFSLLHLDAPDVESWRARMASRGSRSDLPWFADFVDSVTRFPVWAGAHRLSSDPPAHVVLQSALDLLQG